MGLIDSKKITRLFSLKKKDRYKMKNTSPPNISKNARTFECYASFNWKLLYVIMYNLHLW